MNQRYFLSKKCLKSSTLNLFSSGRGVLCKKVRKSHVANGEKKRPAKVREKRPPSPRSKLKPKIGAGRHHMRRFLGDHFSPKARAFGARGAPSAASPQSPHTFSTACRYDVWLSRTRPLKLGQNAVARARAAGAAAGGARHHDDRQRAVGRPGAGATAPLSAVKGRAKNLQK